MSLYQFHFIGADGGRPALDFSHCADDGEAVREGMRHLGEHGSALAVEVWQGERMVVRMERAAEEVRRVGARAPDLHQRRSLSRETAALPPVLRLQR